MACSVAQWIPTVEAFLARGAAPSEQALALAERDSPFMRWVVDWGGAVGRV